MTQTHTPTPWRLTGKATIRSDVNFVYICTLELSNRAANAAFIIQAVNAHDDLVAALEAARTLGMKIYHNANAHEAPQDWATVKRLIDAALVKAAAS